MTLVAHFSERYDAVIQVVVALPARLGRQEEAPVQLGGGGRWSKVRASALQRSFSTLFNSL